jgi:CO/xanthine dehydrogenase FAD-binding subunit
VGSKLEPESIAAAADAAFAVGRPLDNASATIPYRKRMVRVFAQRVLEDIANPQ